MKCYKHNNKDAVGQCSSCSKGVCNDCSVDVNERLFCKSCAATGKAAKHADTSTMGHRDPGIAALLSFFFLGAGQLYNGQIKKFVILWIINLSIIIISTLLMFILIGFLTILLVIPVWLYGIYDAYNSAKEINKKLD